MSVHAISMWPELVLYIGFLSTGTVSGDSQVENASSLLTFPQIYTSLLPHFSPYETDT